MCPVCLPIVTSVSARAVDEGVQGHMSLLFLATYGMSSHGAWQSSQFAAKGSIPSMLPWLKRGHSITSLISVHLYCSPFELFLCGRKWGSQAQFSLEKSMLAVLAVFSDGLGEDVHLGLRWCWPTNYSLDALHCIACPSIKMGIMLAFS